MVEGSLYIFDHELYTGSLEDENVTLLINMKGSEVIQARCSIVNDSLRDDGKIERKRYSCVLNGEYIKDSFLIKHSNLSEYFSHSIDYLRKTNPDFGYIMSSLQKYFIDELSEDEIFSIYVNVCIVSALFSMKLTSIPKEKIGTPFDPFDIPKVMDPDEIPIINKYKLDMFGYYAEAADMKKVKTPGIRLLSSVSFLKKNLSFMIDTGPEIGLENCTQHRSILNVCDEVKKMHRDVADVYSKILDLKKHLDKTNNIKPIESDVDDVDSLMNMVDKKSN